MTLTVEQRIRRARRRHRRREAGVAYLFLTPNLVAFALFLLVPVVMVVRQSLYSGGVLGPATYVGLDNWRDVFHDSGAIGSIENSGRFTVLFVPLVLVLSLGVALLLRGVRRGGTVLRAVVYVPTLAPLVLAATIWVFMVHPDFGLFTAGARGLGFGKPNWLGDSNLALGTIISLELWRSVGFWAVLVLAALLAVPGELYEAARVDGASPLRRFVHVTLPSVRPTLIVVVLLATIGAMQVFDSVYVLTRGGPAGSTTTVGLYVYQSIFESGEPGFGAALSILLLLVVVAATGGLALLARQIGRRA
jgi:ABC-type sugar transport system permease subunit